jgi:hypothetical protein
MMTKPRIQIRATLRSPSSQEDVNFDATEDMSKLPLEKIQEIWTDKGIWLNDELSISAMGIPGLIAQIDEHEMVSEICRNTTGFTPKVARIGCVTFDMWEVFCEKVHMQSEQDKAIHRESEGARA